MGSAFPNTSAREAIADRLSSTTRAPFPFVGLILRPGSGETVSFAKTPEPTGPTCGPDDTQENCIWFSRRVRKQWVERPVLARNGPSWTAMSIRRSLKRTANEKAPRPGPLGMLATSSVMDSGGPPKDRLADWGFLKTMVGSWAVAPPREANVNAATAITHAASAT
jgi:hypothetical protein